METVSMIEDLLRQIQAEQAQHQQHVRPGATAQQVQSLRQRCQAALGVAPPQQYLDFLRLSDGLNYNGVFIYDCDSSPQQRSGRNFWQGLVPANLLWRDSPALASLLVLGDSDMDLYALDPADGRIHAIDKVAKERFDAWDSFDAMLEQVLKSRL